MFSGISAMVQALADFGRSLAKLFKQQKQQQSETAMLKDRENLQKASDLTEQTFWLVREYLATDSQFTMWLARLIYGELNKDEKRLFRRFYKQKIKLKNKIEKNQKQFEKVN